MTLTNVTTKLTKTKLALIFGALLIAGNVATTQTASALSGSDWRAGRIIDDSVFFNKDAMTPQQIQAFLNARVPVCDRNNPYKGTVYGSYIQAPYTCLKEYNENPTTKENNIGRFNANGTPYQVPGGISAAQIIWNAGQAYGINPQALIVMLQKETAIVTDTWSAKWQYDRAMGYGCPDSGPGGSANCNTNYYGFYNQVSNAAWQLKRYGDVPDSYNFKAGVTRYIQFDVSAACGGTNVYLENRATAALYNYTPYQPNATALSNIYGGQDDGCSAYGNRNFWRMFNDWFGSTLAPSFDATLYRQSSYTVINSGETRKFFVDYKNSGTAFWKDNTSVFPGYYPTRLAVTNPINRASEFRSGSWNNASRPSGKFAKVFEQDGATLATDQSMVSPGQIARFEFDIYANPSIKGGVYREYFQPILDGAPTWSMGGGVSMDIGIHVPTYKAAYHSQSPYSTIAQGQSQNAYISFKNVGDELWYDTSSVPVGKFPVHLATTWPINRPSVFSGGWPGTARASYEFTKVYEADGVTLSGNQNIVYPNQIARYEFPLSVPNNQAGGFYQEYFQPILEGAPGYSWNLGASAWLGITVPNIENKASFYSQSTYPTISKGSSSSVFLKFKNTGNTIWYDDRSVPVGKFPVHLATTWPINRPSVFSGGWSSPTRPNLTFSAVYEADGVTLAANQQQVLSNQIVHFQFTFSVPSGAQTGFYQEYFQPILEGAPGYSWNLGASAWLGITVN